MLAVFLFTILSLTYQSSSASIPYQVTDIANHETTVTRSTTTEPAGSRSRSSVYTISQASTMAIRFPKASFPSSIHVRPSAVITRRDIENAPYAYQNITEFPITETSCWSNLSPDAWQIGMPTLETILTSLSRVIIILPGIVNMNINLRVQGKHDDTTITEYRSHS